MDGGETGSWKGIVYLGQICVSRGALVGMLCLSAFCRSVHNSRIERVWYDVTHGFGMKWKNFFIDLEVNCGLDINNPTHIWLVHWLFLNTINEDATAWAEVWNYHKIQIHGEHQKMPAEMAFISVYKGGLHGTFNRDPFQVGPLDVWS